MKISNESRRYFKALRPVLLELFAEFLEAEEYKNLVFHERNIHQDRHLIPGRLQLFAELPELLDKAFKPDDQEKQ